jgi:hypothetical protein
LSIANRQNGTPVDNHGALLSVASDSWCPFVDCHGALLSVAYTENKYRNPPPKSERETPPVDNSEDWRRRIFEEQARASADHESATSVQPPMAVARPTTGAEASDAQALVVPAGVDSARALQVVNHAPAELRQVVLDELAGNLRSQRKAISSPLGYLHSLVCKASAGTLIAPLAAEVSQQRRAHAEAKAREALGLGRAELDKAVDQLEAAVQERDPAVIEEGRARLMSARAQIIAAGAARSIGSGVQHDE